MIAASLSTQAAKPPTIWQKYEWMNEQPSVLVGNLFHTGSKLVEAAHSSTYGLTCATYVNVCGL